MFLYLLYVIKLPVADTVSDVMPPDEWHYPVNNSAFTNLAAHLAITLPDYLDPSVKFSQQLIHTRYGLL